MAAQYSCRSYKKLSEKKAVAIWSLQRAFQIVSCKACLLQNAQQRAFGEFGMLRDDRFALDAVALAEEDDVASGLVKDLEAKLVAKELDHFFA